MADQTMTPTEAAHEAKPPLVDRLARFLAEKAGQRTEWESYRADARDLLAFDDLHDARATAATGDLAAVEQSLREVVRIEPATGDRELRFVMTDQGEGYEVALTASELVQEVRDASRPGKGAPAGLADRIEQALRDARVVDGDLIPSNKIMEPDRPVAQVAAEIAAVVGDGGYPPGTGPARPGDRPVEQRAAVLAEGEAASGDVLRWVADQGARGTWFVLGYGPDDDAGEGPRVRMVVGEIDDPRQTAHNVVAALRTATPAATAEGEAGSDHDCDYLAVVLRTHDALDERYGRESFKVESLDDRVRHHIFTPALAPAATAEPEIVTGEQAAQLPPGSRVVHTGYYEPDLPEPGSRVVMIAKGYTPPQAPRRVMVLHRAPEPAPTITVGMEITTAAQLDACPVGTALHTAPIDGRRRFVEKLLDRKWYEAGVPAALSRTGLLPADLLVLGTGA